MLHQHDGNNQTSLIAIKADSQSSLVAPADVSLSGIAEGIELQLAATGVREAIRRYLDRQLAQFGRQVELHSADTISCEAGHRRVALLASEHRLINGSCPGGPGSVDEMVGVLRVMAADVSQSASPSDGMPMLVQRDRRLVEYTPGQRPPDVEVTPVTAREVLTRHLRMAHAGPWPYFRQNADLTYTSHIPEDLTYGRSFWVDEDGRVRRGARVATQADLRDAMRCPTPGLVVKVPDCDPIDDLEDFTGEHFAPWLRSRLNPGVVDVAELTAPPGTVSLAERMAGLAVQLAPSLWKGGKAKLAADLAWSGSVMSLNSELRRSQGELAALGWTLAKGTGAGRAGSRSTRSCRCGRRPKILWEKFLGRHREAQSLRGSVKCP